MKLYTKTGDGGETGLFGGARVPKDDPRVAAYGDLDETNAAIGLAAATCQDGDVVTQLRAIQSDLFGLGARLASPGGDPGTPVVDDERIACLERWIDAAWAEVGPLKNFVLPGGGQTAAGLHLARTVCRRAERAVVGLARGEAVDPVTVRYLNRLSDLLFALSRLMNHRTGVADVPWTARQ
ncbi:MAG: cob(I)yrinic acid a,c-diamide adenosyltransferase [Phycisphaerae bacterium]